jgi:hypothetical protein
MAGAELEGLRYDKPISRNILAIAEKNRFVEIFNGRVKMDPRHP